MWVLAIANRLPPGERPDHYAAWARARDAPRATISSLHKAAYFLRVLTRNGLETGRLLHGVRRL